MLTYEFDHEEIVTQVDAPMGGDSPDSIPIALIAIVGTGQAIPTFGTRKVMTFEKQNIS